MTAREETPSHCTLTSVSALSRPAGDHRRKALRWTSVTCNRALITYPARSSTAFLGSGWSSLSSSSSAEIILSDTARTDCQSVCLWGFSKLMWIETEGEILCHFMSHLCVCVCVCVSRGFVCVSRGFDLLAQLALSSWSELENVLMSSTFSLYFCRTGREWSVSLSYSGWPWH